MINKYELTYNSGKFKAFGKYIIWDNELDSPFTSFKNIIDAKLKIAALNYENGLKSFLAIRKIKSYFDNSTLLSETSFENLLQEAEAEAK